MISSKQQAYMKNKKILIVAPYQFGELSDCYYWAKYAVEDGWNVTYLGYRYNQRKMKERKCKGVKVVSVYHFNNRILLGICFFAKLIFEIIFHNHNNIIVCKFPHVEKLVRIFPKRRIILDIRTLSVSSNDQERKTADDNTRRVALHFSKCSVISEGVKNKLNIDATVLPLGAECISNTSKDFSSLKLFYIGTFDNRKLSIFLQGLSLFNKAYSIPFTFDIVGGGNKTEEESIKSIIQSEGLNNVTLHGVLTHDEAKKFFDECNVGVCYVPMTEYYEHQPPTKLYEYLLSGMVCIATNTTSNKQVMTKDLGVLINDDAQSVCDGLYKLFLHRTEYSSKYILEVTKKYHWKQIVKNSFIKLLKK